ncbi:hypothetical protein ACP70R_045902 [Stipagrostis hirtigluma subsp. patula]
MKRKVVQGNIMSFFAKAQKNSSSSTPATSERIQICEGLVGESQEGRVTEENGSRVLVTYSAPHVETENTPTQDACPGPIVTGFGVDAANHDPGTSSQFAGRGRTGSTSQFWMGRARCPPRGSRREEGQWRSLATMACAPPPVAHPIDLSYGSAPEVGLAAIHRR